MVCIADAAMGSRFLTMRTSRETQYLKLPKLVNLVIYTQNTYCFGWYTNEDGHVVCKIMACKCTISSCTVTPNAGFFSSITLKRSMPSPGIEGPANQRQSTVSKHQTLPTLLPKV